MCIRLDVSAKYHGRYTASPVIQSKLVRLSQDGVVDASHRCDQTITVINPQNIKAVPHHYASRNWTARQEQ